LLEPVIGTGYTSVDVGASANLEVVVKFCCLGDMLSVDGDADAAVEARIRIGWNNSGSWYHCLPIVVVVVVRFFNDNFDRRKVYRHTYM